MSHFLYLSPFFYVQKINKNQPASHFFTGRSKPIFFCLWMTIINKYLLYMLWMNNNSIRENKNKTCTHKKNWLLTWNLPKAKNISNAFNMRTSLAAATVSASSKICCCKNLTYTIGPNQSICMRVSVRRYTDNKNSWALSKRAREWPYVSSTFRY